MLNPFGAPSPIPVSASPLPNRISAASVKIIPSMPPPDLSGRVPSFSSNIAGALFWFQFGFKVIPMVPGKKRPAVHHYPWADTVTEYAIRDHWSHHPDHEVGAILDKRHLLIDADTPEAHAALQELEAQFGVDPALIVTTRRGHHHHYRLALGVFAKPDSHSTSAFPERLDVRAQHNSILLTPSQNKSIHHLAVHRREQMPLVEQDFVDAVFAHNGRPAPRPAAEVETNEPFEGTGDLDTLSRLLRAIDPDCGYQDWVAVLMGIFHETGGSPEGLDLADDWSKAGGTYEGRSAIEAKWASFNTGTANPVTIGTIIMMARAGGAHIEEIMAEQFQPCETEIINPEQPGAVIKPDKPSPLERYSLSGKAEQYRELAQEAKPLLGDVCLLGESTVWYAKHNIGKTLLMLHLLIEAVLCGRIEGQKVYYINADDSSAGLADKLELLEEVRVHTLVPGQAGFKASDLEDLMLQAVKDGSAAGTFLILDTLKKFVDLMHKAQSSRFSGVCRQFTTAGGTVLGLGHINKRRGEDGKAVHAGTTDILNDFDAGYIIDEVTAASGAGIRIVQFDREKTRGGGVAKAAYSYASEDGLSYEARLASVQPVALDDLDHFRQQKTELSDADIIACIERCIAEGINTKMAMRNAAAEKASASKLSVLNVIERYTGDDPAHHKWNFARRDHGKQVFWLLGSQNEAAAQ